MYSLCCFKPHQISTIPSSRAKGGRAPVGRTLAYTLIPRARDSATVQRLKTSATSAGRKLSAALPATLGAVRPCAHNQRWPQRRRGVRPMGEQLAYLHQAYEAFLSACARRRPPRCLDCMHPRAAVVSALSLRRALAQVFLRLPHEQPGPWASSGMLHVAFRRAWRRVASCHYHIDTTTTAAAPLSPQAP